MKKYTFEYDATKRTVTVKADSLRAARHRAREKLDARYEKAGKSDRVPVAWALTLVPERVPRDKTIEQVVEYLEGVLGLRVYGPYRTFDPPVEQLGCMDYDMDSIKMLREIGVDGFTEEHP